VAAIAVEQDSVLRTLELLLAREVPRERLAAMADYFAHDAVDFGEWLARAPPGLARYARPRRA
jgi:hypothetical protein